MNPITRSVPDRETHSPEPLAWGPQRFCEEGLLFAVPKEQDKMAEGTCFSIPAGTTGT